MIDDILNALREDSMRSKMRRDEITGLVANIAQQEATAQIAGARARSGSGGPQQPQVVGNNPIPGGGRGNVNLSGLSGLRNPLTGHPYITSPYGMRTHPITGEYKLHDGIDFHAEYGTPIYAVSDGVVKDASMLSGYGNSVRLKLGNHWQTQYSHLSKFNVKPGQRVHKGDIIGYVGDTGFATAPHLHWMLFKRGQTVNPYKYLRGYK